MTSHNRHPPKLSSERRLFQDSWFPHSRIVFFSSRTRTGMIVWMCALGEIQHLARGNGHTKPALNLHTRASEHHTGKNALRVTTEWSCEFPPAPDSPRPSFRRAGCWSMSLSLAGSRPCVQSAALSPPISTSLSLSFLLDSLPSVPGQKTRADQREGSIVKMKSC